MHVIVVGGPHSGVGKTLASELAVRAFSDKGCGAIKLTVADGEFADGHDHGASAAALASAVGVCGRGASCGVCETVSARVPSRTILHRNAIEKRGTDTCRLSEAGAVAVAWIITLRAAAPAAVEGAMRALQARGANAIVIEGTTALEWMQPSLSILVATDPGRPWKRVALEHVAECDIVLRNVLPQAPGDLPAPTAFRAARPVDCNLADLSDAGTVWYLSRLREAASALPDGARTTAR
jgi:hypothetical protein